jgi:hypothetical protein
MPALHDYLLTVFLFLFFPGEILPAMQHDQASGGRSVHLGQFASLP